MAEKLNSNFVLKYYQYSYIYMNISVKAAKCQYFSDILAKNCHKPQTLFTILDSVVNPTSNVCLNALPAVCDSFLKFFTDK